MLFHFSVGFWVFPLFLERPPPTKHTWNASQQVVWKPCKILRSVAPGGAVVIQWTSWFLQYIIIRCLPKIQERVKELSVSGCYFFGSFFYVFLEVCFGVFVVFPHQILLCSFFGFCGFCALLGFVALESLSQLVRRSPLLALYADVE